MQEEDDWGEPSEIEEFGSGSEGGSTESAGSVATEPAADTSQTQGVERKDAPAKKRIPKWQIFVLGGVVVVGVGGGAAAMRLGHGTSQTMTVMHPPMAAPSSMAPVRPVPHSPSPSMPSSASSTAARPDTSSSDSGGFAALNALSGATSTGNTATGPAISAATAAPIRAASPSASASPMASGTTTSPSASSASAGLPAQNADLSQSTSSAPVPSSSDVQETKIVQRLNAQLQAADARIARLQSDLAKRTAEVSDAPQTQTPKVITRTIVRYIRVPEAAPTARSSTVAKPVSNSTMPGWSVVGGNSHEAMLSGPDGQVQSVRVGDVLANGAVVQSVRIGEVRTSRGVIR